MTKYLEIRTGNGNIQVNDTEKMAQLVLKTVKGSDTTYKRSFAVQYALPGESLTERQVHVYYLSQYRNHDYITLLRNPSSTPVHVFTGSLARRFKYVGSTAFYPSADSLDDCMVAIANCTKAVADTILAYTFARRSPAVDTSGCGFEIYDSNGDVILNANSKMLKILNMNSFTHCNSGDEAAPTSYNDINVSLTYQKDIAMWMGYRGLYNHGGDMYRLSANAHFPVAILTNNSIEIKTVVQNNIQNTYYHADTDTGDWGMVVSGSFPSNITNYLVADVTGY